jgi:hypothetical protein
MLKALKRKPSIGCPAAGTPPTGFLVPTETDLSLECDDTADDDFAAADGVDLCKPKKANSEYKPGSGDDGGSSESGPSKPQLFPSSIGVSVLLAPGGELQLIARWDDYLRLAEGVNPDAAACIAREEAGSHESSRELQSWQRTPRQEALVLSHSEIIATRGLRAGPDPAATACISAGTAARHPQARAMPLAPWL